MNRRLYGASLYYVFAGLTSRFQPRSRVFLIPANPAAHIHNRKRDHVCLSSAASTSYDTTVLKRDTHTDPDMGRPATMLPANGDDYSGSTKKRFACADERKKVFPHETPLTWLQISSLHPGQSL